MYHVKWFGCKEILKLSHVSLCFLQSNMTIDAQLHTYVMNILQITLNTQVGISSVGLPLGEFVKLGHLCNVSRDMNYKLVSK